MGAFATWYWSGRFPRIDSWLSPWLGSHLPGFLRAWRDAGCPSLDWDDPRPPAPIHVDAIVDH
jgi:hypothetical protein